MPLATMHPEDLKAELRKRFGSVATFEKRYGLPRKSVTDLLRGRKSNRVKEAVEAVISQPISKFQLSDDSDNSRTCVKAHPQS